MYYFAYGSNLSLAQMTERCPHARAIASARVSNYELKITGHSQRWHGGVATITPTGDSEVWGVVYELDEHCLQLLDVFEGVQEKRYARQQVTCHMADGASVPVITYANTFGEATLWSEQYKNTIIDGAEHFALPDQYIEILRSAMTVESQNLQSVV